MEIALVVTLIIAAIGALNWGLVALFNFDLVAFIAGGMRFGGINPVSRILYLVVAACGIIALVLIWQQI